MAFLKRVAKRARFAAPVVLNHHVALERHGSGKGQQVDDGVLRSGRTDAFHVVHFGGCVEVDGHDHFTGLDFVWRDRGCGHGVDAGLFEAVNDLGSDTGASVTEIPRYGTFRCVNGCLLYTSPSPRDVEESRMPSSA